MKKVAALSMALIMFVTIFSACSAKDSSKTTTTTVKEITTGKYEQKGIGDFQFGTWSDNLFINTWSDIQITLPSKDYTYLSNEDIKSIIHENIAANGDDITSALNSGKTLFVDCCIALPVSDFVSYMLFEYDTTYKGLSPKEYQEKSKKELLSNDSDIVFAGYSDKTIAGRTFFVASYTTTTQSGILSYMDIYARKINNSMLLFGAVYYDESKNDMTALLNSITDTSSAASTTSNRTSPKVQA